MDQDFWHQKWETNQIFFHLNQVHPLLKKYFHLPPGKIMVPLCGKSLDMIWLLEQGHDVVGIEISPIACEAFFNENNLPFEKIGNVYMGEKITIWCEDFFKVPAEAWRGCVGLYDRAALIALPENLRRKYATHLQACLQTNRPTFQKMLLICLEYPQEKMEGPPFSVSEAKVQQLFQETFSIEKLHTEIVPLERLPGTDVFQKAYSLNLKTL